ncbi:molecular chaperone [Enterobacteriaceae bacterium 89]|nr:molecular chaperone [Enterobacteriaceae bacterium 89]
MPITACRCGRGFIRRLTMFRLAASAGRSPLPLATSNQTVRHYLKTCALGFHLVVMLLGGLLLCQQGLAATYLNQTRLIVTDKAREVSFSVVNEGDTPVLMQLWSDRDTVLARPETIKMPFVITPPVFRLEGQKSRAVRLQLLGDNRELPADRESLFWLNALEVPPKPQAKAGSNLLQMAFRTRIKLFYRPAAIAGATSEGAVKQLRATKTAQGLQLENPSPLHISLLSLTLANGKTLTALPDDGMIAPFSHMEVHEPYAEPSAVTWIDDYGVAHVYHF